MSERPKSEGLGEDLRKAGENGTEFSQRHFGLASAPELYPPPQVTGLPAEQAVPFVCAQRTQAKRLLLTSRRCGLTMDSKAQP